MSTMTTVANKATAIFASMIAGLITLLVSFWAFRWGFIQLWEWQHEGRPIMFTLGPETKAAALALVAGLAAFLAAFRCLLRGSKT